MWSFNDSSTNEASAAWWKLNTSFLDPRTSCGTVALYTFRMGQNGGEFFFGGKKKHIFVGGSLADFFLYLLNGQPMIFDEHVCLKGLVQPATSFAVGCTKDLKVCFSVLLFFWSIDQSTNTVRSTWPVVSSIFYVHLYLGKIPMLTNIFSDGLKPPTRAPVVGRYHLWLILFQLWPATIRMNEHGASNGS